MLPAGFLALVATSALLTTSATPSLTLFDSKEEAAAAALQMVYKFLPYYEMGGVITKIGNKYAIGVPRTDWSGDSVQIDHDPDAYRGEIVADYHTHPCNSHSHIPGMFSPADLYEYRIFHEEGFMLDMCTGDIHAFKPGVDKKDSNGLAAGRIVGHIAVSGKVLDAGATESP